jgi:adenylate cyclase
MADTHAVTLLLVDDAPENLAVLSGVLGAHYRIKAALSGEKALRICVADPLPDLILLDVMMPEMDGREVCKRLKANPRTADIPVIFVTAMTDPTDEAHGLALGGVDYISKPFSPAVVLQRVRTHLELKHAREELQRLGRHFSSYLSVEVATGIRRGEIPSEIISQRKTLTVFFSDIAGFTRQTAQMSAEAMTRLLNGYFDAMTEIVRAHQGTLDKYIGDACMVFFGDPHTRGVAEDARACVAMALAMQERVAAMQSDWMAASGGTPLVVRMGIATGPCTVGNFGSASQLTYTLLGTTVNLASRLETHAQPGTVLLAAETHALVAELFVCAPHDPLIAKGFDEPLTTWVVHAPTAPM